MPFSPPERLASVVSILDPAFNKEKNIVTPKLPGGRRVPEAPRQLTQRRSAPSIAASAAPSRRRSAAVSFFCALLHL